MPQMLEQCVMKVMAQGHDEQSAYAICNAVMAESDAPTDEQIATATEAHRTLPATASVAVDFGAIAGPQRLRVLSTNPDGTGQVEIPVLSTGDIDLTKAAGGKGVWKVTHDTLAQLAANYGAHGPVPVGVHGRNPHPGKLTDTGGPMPAFLESVRLEGNILWGRFGIGDPQLFSDLTTGRMRGFSGDFVKDVVWPKATVEGWDVYGGVFTNRPADHNIHFAPTIAASAAVSLTIGLERATTKEREMAEEHVSLAIHEAETKRLSTQLTVANETISSLSARVETGRTDLTAERQKREEAEGKVISLTTELGAVKATNLQLDGSVREHKTAVQDLNRKVVDLTDKWQAAEDANLSAKVLTAMNAAIEKGVPPAVFEEIRKDPVNGMRKTYSTFEAFERQCAVLSGVPFKLPDGKPVKSGHTPGEEADPDAVSLSAPEKEVLDSLKLGTDFIGVMNEEAARKVHEARQKKDSK